MIRFCLVVLALMCMLAPARSQDLQLTIGGGYSSILAPSAFADPIYYGGYGFDHSIPLVFGLRYTFKERRIALSASATYQRLYGQGQTGRAFPAAMQTLQLGEKRVQTHLWTASLGLMWPLLKSANGPYLGFDILVTSVGTIHIARGVLLGEELHTTDEAMTQFGMSLGGGVSAPFFLGSSLDIGFRYVAHGIFGSSHHGKGINALQFLALVAVPISSEQRSQQRAP